jgi:hypothetical protein
VIPEPVVVDQTESAPIANTPHCCASNGSGNDAAARWGALVSTPNSTANAVTKGSIRLIKNEILTRPWRETHRRHARSRQ